MGNIQSFKPIIDRNSRILILGSVPSVESLNKKQYYANKRNQFWKIIFSLYNLTPLKSYDKRIEFLMEKNIALWDVIGVCSREGSLDSNIKNEIPNDFKTLFKKYPNIKYVFFNGNKSYETFKRKVGFKQYIYITFCKLPSTSPAHTVPFESKLSRWKNILIKV
ncbi:DNA-deoxyinosine glycosylase [Clostridium fermenticellae]|uniref:DNA-deoxyinosine glycosylase n=1 Tax=Clostridium fermenticellae TaxID=2068654 RepID=A0A386H316_9CLOT|nr:DNA-deoxyinosine glycosylase [Clostridium fermenticellae]AYD39968.1 DNA-deoxyinosine glycosylase [Clostridium fermenticellae]